MQESLDRIEKKIDKIDIKIDDHIGRISKLEESVIWLKGHVKITVTISLTIIGALAGLLGKILIK